MREGKAVLILQPVDPEPDPGADLTDSERELLERISDDNYMRAAMKDPDKADEMAAAMDEWEND